MHFHILPYRHGKFPHLHRSKASDPVAGGRKDGEAGGKGGKLRARKKRKDRVKGSKKWELE